MFGWFGGGNKSLSMRAAQEELAKDPRIVLLDVRTPEEHRSGHIKGSINVPLDRLPTVITRHVPDKNTRVFVYCLSGSRSGGAASWMTRNGYTDVTNIGGIHAWAGPIAGG